MAALLLMTGCGGKAKEEPRPPAVVKVTQVAQEEIPIYHHWIGTLDGLVNAEIRAQVTGYLLTQDYREGDFVKKGELLFQIDPRPFQAALEVAQGKLAQAEAQLGKTELDVKRFTPLAATRAISQQELDDAIQANLAAKAGVVSAKAEVDQAQLNLGFTRITAPVDGIVGIARAQVGDLVGPSTGDLTMVSTLDPIKVYFTVPEQAYLNYTRKFVDEAERNEHTRQLELRLILSDGIMYPLEGRVFAVDRQVNPATGGLRIEALFPNPGNILRPGLFARVRVTFEKRKSALLVPQRAVTELQGSYQVAVVGSDNKVHIRPVTVGETVGSMWIIEDGLKPGERVVAEGVQKVHENVVVAPKPFEPPKPGDRVAAAKPTG